MVVLVPVAGTIRMFHLGHNRFLWAIPMLLAEVAVVCTSAVGMGAGFWEMAGHQ